MFRRTRCAPLVAAGQPAGDPDLRDLPDAPPDPPSYGASMDISPTTVAGAGHDRRAVDPVPVIGAVAAGLWIVVGILQWLDGFVDGGDWEGSYGIFSLVLLLAAAGTAATAVAGTPAPLSFLRIVALVATALGVLATVVAWATVFWMTVIAVGYLLLAGSAPGRRGGLLVLAGAQLAGVAVTIGALAIGVGPTDSYGDHPQAFALGTATAAILTCAGLWLVVARRSAGADLPAG